MFFVVALLIMVSVYVVRNERLSDGSRMGYFITLAVILVLLVIYNFILG